MKLYSVLPLLCMAYLLSESMEQGVVRLHSERLAFLQNLPYLEAQCGVEKFLFLMALENGE